MKGYCRGIAGQIRVVRDRGGAIISGMHVEPIQYEREIPLFPLPNCVLFPGVVQPLHIFEPRYRRMMADAVGDGGQGAVAMALLKPGWEKQYYGAPAIHPILCVGRVIAHEKLDDGKYNLLLQGVSRARVKSEGRCAGEWGTYRLGRLEPVADAAGHGEAHEALLRRLLGQIFEKSALKDLTVTPALQALFEESVPLSRLLDALAFSLVQEAEAKQRMLEAVDLPMRGELLLREMVALAGRLGPATTADWPPALGKN